MVGVHSRHCWNVSRVMQRRLTHGKRMILVRRREEWVQRLHLISCPKITSCFPGLLETFCSLRRKKNEHICGLVENLKSEIPCTALLHTESLKEKKRGRKKCLFNLNGEWRKEWLSNSLESCHLAEIHFQIKLSTASSRPFLPSLPALTHSSPERPSPFPRHCQRKTTLLHF